MTPAWMSLNDSNVRMLTGAYQHVRERAGPHAAFQRASWHAGAPVARHAKLSPGATVFRTGSVLYGNDWIHCTVVFVIDPSKDTKFA